MTKKLFLLLGTFLMGVCFAGLITLAQTPAQTPTPFAIDSTLPLANCPTPQTGHTITCYALEGTAISVNGAAYVLIPLTATAAGVTSISVNGGTAQTGAVKLTIATKGTTTVQSTAITTLQ